jgi:hypothetical protein
MTSMLGNISIDVGDFSSGNGARLSLSIDARARAGIVQSEINYYDTGSGEAGQALRCGLLPRVGRPGSRCRGSALSGFVPEALVNRQRFCTRLQS